MKTRREFRQIRFGRQLDTTRLRAVLSQTMRETAKDPAPQAAPARLESVLIEPQETTVYLSGNGAGLNAVAAALRNDFPAARISKARPADAKRPPRGLSTRRRKESDMA
jgi:uncharacterized protein